MKMLKFILSLFLLTTNVLAQSDSSDLHKFLTKMGAIEGHGSYSTVSPTGYLGKYQFHYSTIRSLGFRVSRREFLRNHTLQDSVMIAYMRMNSRELKKLISRRDGTYYNGVYVTKAGILASAHLVGSAGVWAYFYPNKYKYRVVDGNGVHVRQYMRIFSVYRNLTEL